VIVVLSFSRFQSDRLAGCADAEFELPKTDGGAFDAAKFEEAFADLVKAGASKKKASSIVRIKKRCETQFADRTVFASCAKETILSPTATMRSKNFIYLFEAVFRKDEEMKNCIKDGGDWWSLPRDSSEFAGAKFHNDVDTLRRLGEQATRDLESAQ